MTTPLRWHIPPHWSDTHGPRPLLMLTTSYPATPNAIAGCFVKTLAENLVKTGHRVVVVTPAGPNISPHPGFRQPGRRTTNGVEVVRVAYPNWQNGPFHTEGLPELLENPTNRLQTTLLIVAACTALAIATWHEARQLGPRTEMIGHWLWPSGAIVQLLRRLLGLSATTVCHSGAVRLATSLPPMLARPLVHLGLGQGPFVATCSALVSLMENATGEDLSHRTHIAPMPAPIPQRIGRPPASPPFRVLTLGRHVPVKGLDLLIAAAAGHTNLVLEICGDGPERPALEAMCRQYGVQATFHGIQTGTRKAELLSTCHGFASTSRRLASGRTEGVPVAILEALSYDLPILATQVGGVEEVLCGTASTTVCAPHVASIQDALPRFMAYMKQRAGAV